MLVKNWMNRSVITINANDSMEHATKLLKQHDIHMFGIDRFRLPLLEDAIKQKVNLLYMVDHQDKGRMAY